MDWKTILGSGFLAAIISAWVAKAIAERRIYVEHITRERAKWRERIRGIAQEYPIADGRQKIRLEIELVSRLNPYDCEDLELLNALRNANENDWEDLAVRVALLLKHDWERAKNEARPPWRQRISPVRRLSFREYMDVRKHYDEGNKDEFVKKIMRLTEDESCI